MNSFENLGASMPMEYRDMPLVLDQQRTENKDLEALKIGLHEASAKEADVISQGDLSTVYGSNAEFFGSIGAHSDQLTVETELTSQTYVPASKGSRVRCVDPRTLEGYDDNDSAAFTEPLGPQMAGATAGTAAALGLAYKSAKKNTSATFADDYAIAADIDLSLGYLPDLHTDDHCASDSIGCGDVKFKPENIKLIHRDIQNVKLAAQNFLAALELPFDAKIFDQMVSASVDISEGGVYFPAPKEIVEISKEYNPNACYTVTGSHKEKQLNVNLVEDTTYHANHYNALNDEQGADFNLDIWYIVEQASQLPNDEMRLRYLTAQAILTPNTLRFLTNGNLNLNFRTPKA
jgi:hypothetical protein